MSIRRENRAANGSSNKAKDNNLGGMQEEVGKVLNKAQEITKTLTDSITALGLPDQAQQVVSSIYTSMSYTLMAALEMAENMLKIVQDSAKNSPVSPFVSAGLEQLGIATGELTSAIKKVSEILTKLGEGGVQQSKDGGSWFGGKETKTKPTTRFSFATKK